MTPRRAWLFPLWLGACDPHVAEPCRTEADCSRDEHCLVDHARGEGRCIATPGRTDPAPAMRWRATPPQTDLVLVIDDGPDSAPLQRRLLASIDAIIDHASRFDDDLRIAATTANIERSPCGPAPAASRGVLTGLSCLDRLDDFIGADGTDARSLCTGHCAWTSEQLGLSPRRPWLDLRALPEGIEPDEALGCLLPQGISGCPLAAPLESMRLAIARSNAEEELSFGFFRKPGTGEFVVVTDDVDCSLSSISAPAFDPEGLRALWSDPDAEEPTAAVCFNAGVDCSGLADGFRECRAVDRALDGTLTADNDASVLSFLHHYVELFDFSNYTVHAIVGVPEGTPWTPPYSAVGDPEHLLEYGIDPGCTDDEIVARPPVRLRDVASEMASACAPNYDDTFIRALSREPLCIPSALAPRVQVSLERPDAAPWPVPDCEGTWPGIELPDGGLACMRWNDDPLRCSSVSETMLELVLLARDREAPTFLIDPSPLSAEG
ncbi:MAG: hypothetical protein AAF799_10895 [Myxococcota bacterium]